MCTVYLHMGYKQSSDAVNQEIMEMIDNYEKPKKPTPTWKYIVFLVGLMVSLLYVKYS